MAYRVHMPIWNKRDMEGAMKLVFTERMGDRGYGLYCEDDVIGISIFVCLVGDNELINLGMEKLCPDSTNLRVSPEALARQNSEFRFSFSGYVFIDVHNVAHGIDNIDDIFGMADSPYKRYTHNPKDVFDLIKELPLMSEFSDYIFEISI